MFRTALTALLLVLTGCGPAASQIVGYKNFAMPTEVFKFPVNPLAPVDAAGPQTGVTWDKTNVPNDPSFTKLRDDTAIDCSFIIDVHTTTAESPIFLALMLNSAKKNTGVIYSQNGTMFTFQGSSGTMFPGFPAGTVNITLWMYAAPSNPSWIDSPEEVMQCYEVQLPTPQDPGGTNIYLKGVRGEKAAATKMREMK